MGSHRPVRGDAGVSAIAERRFRGMRFGTKVLHGATLAFTAFWLIATSRAPAQVQECFPPLRGRVLTLTLGPVVPPEPNAGPPCQGLDGLVDGSRLRIDVVRAGKPPSISNGEHVCWKYDATRLDGPHGVSKIQPVKPHRYYDTAFVETLSTFEGATPSCAGEHRFLLRPAGTFRQGMRVDPYRAGAGEVWRMRRAITLKNGGSCDTLPAIADSGYCEDTFEVRSIAHGR